MSCAQTSAADKGEVWRQLMRFRQKEGMCEKPCPPPLPTKDNVSGPTSPFFSSFFYSLLFVFLFICTIFSPIIGTFYLLYFGFSTGYSCCIWYLLLHVWAYQYNTIWNKVIIVNLTKRIHILKVIFTDFLFMSILQVSFFFSFFLIKSELTLRLLCFFDNVFYYYFLARVLYIFRTWKLYSLPLYYRTYYSDAVNGQFVKQYRFERESLSW